MRVLTGGAPIFRRIPAPRQNQRASRHSKRVASFNQSQGAMDEGKAQSRGEPRQPPQTSQPDVEQKYPSGLWGEMELLSGETLSRTTRERWTDAYRQLGRDAQELGIPLSAIPTLPDGDTITKEDLRRVRDHLNAMIQSFLSAAL